jgi:hypothetical protein
MNEETESQLANCFGTYSRNHPICPICESAEQCMEHKASTSDEWEEETQGEWKNPETKILKSLKENIQYWLVDALETLEDDSLDLTELNDLRHAINECAGLLPLMYYVMGYDKCEEDVERMKLNEENCLSNEK